MLIQSIHIDGLRNAPADDLPLVGRFATLPRVPAGTAVADGLTLLQAALSLDHTRAGLDLLGVCTSETEISVEMGRPDEVTGLNPGAVRDLLGSARRVTVSATIALDPILYGELRQHALKDPWVVDALSGGSALIVRVGWLFTNDLEVASISRLGVSVGGQPLKPPGGSQAPAWVDAMMERVADRIGRIDPNRRASEVAARLLDHALSSDPALRRRYARAAASLGQPPFNLGTLELVRRGDEVIAAFAPDLVSARQLGPAAADALRLVEAALVDQPDVLVVESGGAHQADPIAVTEWLTNLTTVDEAPIEQVVFVAPGVGRDQLGASES